MDPIRAVEGYGLKTQALRVMQDLTAKLPAMTADIGAKFTELAEVKAGVQAIVSALDIPTMQYSAYQAFAYEVWRKVKQFSGGVGMVNEVALLIAKWKARGLTEGALNSIRDYFTIAEPTP
jgi:hypothetical protein